MRRLERGASYVPLIIVIVLLIVAVVWAYTKHSEAHELLMAKKKAEADLLVELDRKASAEAHLTKVGHVAGFPIAADDQPNKKFMRYGTDEVLAKAFIANKLSALRSDLVREFPENVYTIDEQGGVKFAQSADSLTIGYIPRGQIPSETTLENLYGYMHIAMNRMLHDITRLVRVIEVKQNEFETKVTGYDEQLVQKDSANNDLRDQYNTLQSNASQAERDLRDQINGLQDQVRAAEDKADEADKVAREAQSQLKSQIAALRQDVRKLKQRREIAQDPIGPDGSILSVTADQGLVVIDRGKANHLQTDTTFTVYSYGKGAQKIYKGAIVVLDVDDHVAKARVVELKNPLMPITAGDEIESLTYNPEEKLNFVLIGRFKKYGRSDAKRRLMDLGLGVENMVSIETDYLVLGAPEREDENLRDSDDYKKAQELGIRIITEDQLSRFLRY